MFLAVSLLILFLTLSITGSPVEVRNSLITLPLTRRLNFYNGTIDFLQHDKARLASLRGCDVHVRRADGSIPVKSSSVSYHIQVGIGEPPTTYKLLVDTGSSITWVGNDKTYVRTGTSFMTGREVEQHYGSEASHESSFSGPTVYDTVTLGDGLTVIFFELAVASDRSGFSNDMDGILGIGREAGTVGKIIDDPLHMIPTFTSYLLEQHMIKEDVVAIFFQPITREIDSQIGELTFGGIDSTKCVDKVVYAHITAGSSRHWAIDQRIAYGETTILGTTAGLVDTGTTFLYIRSDAFKKYQAVTGGTWDLETGLLSITNNQYADLRSLDFHIEYEDEDVHEIISLTPDAQIWPRSLNTKLNGGLCGIVYLIVQDNGEHPVRGQDFILGSTFIQRFYTVFDGSRKSVGFAPTLFTDAITNIHI